MTYVFWQNIVSIHQSAFLREMSLTSKVILIVEREIEDQRIKDGWSVPDLGSVEILTSPNLEEMNSILDLKNAVHVFSGIDAYPLMKQGLDIAVKKKATIGVMSEPFDWLGLKGKLRFLKFIYLRMKYDKHISFILAIGNKARWCYERTGFKKEKIFDWGYFTERPLINIGKKNETKSKPTIIYIGRFNNAKGILPLLKISQNAKEMFSKFYIIGGGELENEVKGLIGKDEQYELLGNIPNNDIYSYLIKSDLCILPSIGKDGWGAVVNEALMCGTPVISSDNCGASVLLKGERGEVFSVKTNNLEDVLKKWLRKGKISSEKRYKIKDWADNNISGKAASSHFVKIVRYVVSENSKKPIALWLENKDSF